KEEQDFFHTYKRLSMIVERGEGCYLYTDKGEKILDMFGGLAVNSLGYNHPRINEAIEAQIKKYIHVSNFFYQEKQIALAEILLKFTGFSKVFFSNSGTESTEAAIKLIRKYFIGTGRKELVSFSGSFHGRTMGALSLTSRKKYRELYAPLLEGVAHLEFNSIKDLEENINENTAGIFIECIQGEGGVNFAASEFVNKINELKRKFEFIVVADEIQSGIGRTGKMHGFEHFGLEADIILLAKGIGGGLPLGAVLGSSRVENVFTYGDHGSTFGGNPVAAACGIVIFEELQNGMLNNNAVLGKYLMNSLKSIQSRNPEKITDVRGKGLMIGIQLSFPGQPVVEKLIKEGVLVNCTNENVIRLLPPYIITEKDIDMFTEKFESVISSGL
ncbi:MAG: aspartate aminotransferase family protein, partial [Ignavibacteria bacterium]